MVMFGLHLLSITEELQSIELQELYNKIKDPDDKALATITRLRTLRNIDKVKYAQMKKELPFFVCGIFNPKFRKKDNFAYTEYFVIDIDNIAEKNLDMGSLVAQIQNDPRTVMQFISPSCDGIKIIFQLQDRCYDAGMYSMFYRSFVHQFSEEYHLDQVIDAKTCDVSRACFLSYDPRAYFNPQAQKIDLSTYLQMENVCDVFSHDVEILQEQKDKEKENKLNEIQLPTDPDKNTLQYIEQILGQRKAQIQAEKPHAFVPQILDEVIDDVTRIIEETGIKVTNVQDIQYGKKIYSSLGLRTSEVNIFFGKKGFSVVQSPKRGCSAELNEVIADILTCYFQLS